MHSSREVIRGTTEINEAITFLVFTKKGRELESLTPPTDSPRDQLELIDGDGDITPTSCMQN
jgi:hypothetical protein